MSDSKDESDPEATYRAIGRFMFEFSQLEYAIRHYAGIEAGLKEESFTAIMTHDFSMLCSAAMAVLTRSLHQPESREGLASIIKECRKLNDVRVRVAHGLWVPFMGGGTVHHVSRQSLKITMSLDQAEELEKHADMANHLRKSLEDLMWDDWH